MKIFILVLFSAGLSSCVGSNFDPKEYTENPCQDVLYQKLKKMKVSEMTESEREYFIRKDKDCERYSAQVKEDKSEKKQADRNLIYILSGLGLLIGIGLFLSLALKGWH